MFFIEIYIDQTNFTILAIKNFFCESVVYASVIIRFGLVVHMFYDFMYFGIDKPMIRFQR